MKSLRQPARRRGFTLIEMIISGFVSVMLGAALWTLMRSSYDTQYTVLNENLVNTTTRQAIDTFADNLRGSAGITLCDGSSLTYTNNSGQNVRYWLSGTNLLKTVNALPAGGTTVVSNVSAMTFSYWTWNGTAWVASSTPGTPSAVSAVDFAVTLSLNGASRKISGSAKIRQK